MINGRTKIAAPPEPSRQWLQASTQPQSLNSVEKIILLVELIVAVISATLCAMLLFQGKLETAAAAGVAGLDALFTAAFRIARGANKSFEIGELPEKIGE